MKRNEFENLLKSLAESWSRRDYNSAAKFFDEEVHYGDPLRYSFSNRHNFRHFLKQMKAMNKKQNGTLLFSMNRFRLVQQSIHMKAPIAIMEWF